MQRYYFDVIDEDSFADTEGVEFADSVTMRKQTMRAAGSMIAEITDFPSNPWTMVVRDGKQKTIATLSLSASTP